MTSTSAVLAIASGFFASLASVATKLLVHPALVSLLEHVLPANSLHSTLFLRALSLAAVILTNLAMWYTFSRALAAAKTTVQVTTLNTLTNLLITAVMGTLVFGETVRPVQFWIGLALIGAGTIVLNTGEEAKDKEKTE
ncbi:hypothetical protein BCR44DRAFT_34321, partial [Catenaria anguillulae PL171]